MQGPPELSIPPSPHIVNVSIIDTTATIQRCSARLFLSSPVKGYDWMACPVFSFLVQHAGLDRSVLFDLGIRKYWQNLSPPLLSQIKASGWRLHVEKDVGEVLDQAGVDTNSIETIIWSHHHFDHVGDPTTFPRKTSLVVGPGFKTMLPGHPTNPGLAHPRERSGQPAADRTRLWLGQHLQPLTIGRFRALDYFGDGSFYLLDSPGHNVGHISALARVTSSPASFVLLPGDAIHHLGEIRPSKFLPLPQNIIPDPFAPDPHPLESHYGCPSAVFDSLFADRGRPSCRPIYEPARANKTEEAFHHDVDEAMRTTEKLQEADAHDDVFVVAAAHDEALLLDHVVFFPRGQMNAFAERGWVERVRWRFLREFATAVGKRDHGVGRRDWGPAGKPRQAMKDLRTA